MAKLIVLAPSGEERDFDLEGRSNLVVGRDPGCDIVVRRRMASRHHAEIVCQDSRFFVRDHNTLNGTFVNNRPVREAELMHGDEIRVADWYLRFVAFAPPPRDQEEDTLRLERAPAPTDLLEITHDDLTPPPGAPARPVVARVSRGGAVDPLPAMPVLTADSLRGVLDKVREAKAPRPAPPADGKAERADSRTTGSGRPAEPAFRPAAAAPSGKVPSPLEHTLVPWLVALALLATVALALVLLRDGGEPRRAVPAAAPASVDTRTLEEAMGSSGEQRLSRLWDFIARFPQSPERERAYLALLESGATALAVCDHVERIDPGLLREGSELSRRCGAP